ncbi:hypothetical protein GCM10010909_27270 [Acidocella aquatica]|uniref:Magnesium transporter n=1 Tax=Acidocella aquatica TaxID=1922313 RepID=A0ABQ6A6J5_9PROT|nr:CorA family divalent cation transporter [Acidocella aquatica]GLR68046.1 hypothetical protein GCM10010909_27270 [Acidocella aquatica]
MPKPGAATKPPAALAATFVSADGVRQVESKARLRELAAGGRFFWLDIAGGSVAARAELLSELELDEADATWLQRFGQTGRMTIERERLLAVTWVAEHGRGLVEIHVLCTSTSLLTVWNGTSAVLDEIREHFAERAAALEKSPHHAAGILLQLLLGTLQLAISELDDRFQTIEMQLGQKPESVDFPALTGRFQTLQSAWSNIDRYSSAVRTAIVGVEALPGMNRHAARELNDYASQVADVERRLHERSEWAAKMSQDYATAIAQRQGEQINRLTIVSLIFLPLTFLTGFFGMNFFWLERLISGGGAFLMLGILLPVLVVIAVVAWLKRLRLL